MWIAYSLGVGDPHYDACRRLFDDLHDGKRTVGVSALVVGEVVQVTRREAARGVAGKRGGSAPDLQAAREMADKAVADFLYRLSTLNGAGHVTILRPSNNARRYPGLALRMLIRHRGRFERHGKRGIIYRNLGMFDMMHALTARDHGANDFCTRDRQFGALTNDPTFDLLNFVIL